MKSFFSRIQNKFSASYGGRYIETILTEISKDDKSIIRALFPNIDNNGYLETEYSFEVNDRIRISDIVLICQETGEPLAFAEIKYDDHMSPKNSAQLNDYIEICKKYNIDFVYLTQYYPRTSELELIKKHGYKHLLFSDYAEILTKNNISELSNLFVDFLKDKGLVMEKLSSDYLGKLLARLFNPVKGQRVQKNMDMVQNIPENFSALMTNVNVIAQELSQYLITDRNPTIDFFLRPSYKISKNDITEMLENSGRGKIDFTPNGVDKNGGSLYSFARSSLVEKHEKDDWSAIEFGFCFTIEKGSKEYTSELYSTVYGKYFSKDHYCSKKIGNSVVSDKQKCVTYLKSLIVESIDSATNDPEKKKIHEKSLNLIKTNIER